MDAYVYNSKGNKSRTGTGGGGGGDGGGGGASSPFGRDIFYWPDMARADANGNVVCVCASQFTNVVTRLIARR